MSPPFPASVAKLFWEVDPCAVDLEAHRDYVLERVLSRGGWEAMQWLRATYSKAALASFIERKGHARLAPRELAYWSLIAEVEAAPQQGANGKHGWSSFTVRMMAVGGSWRQGKGSR